MPPSTATINPRRLLWHGAAGACAGLDAMIDGELCGPLRWLGSGPGCWQVSVPLGDLTAGVLCVPCLILGSEAISGYRMRLRWAESGLAELVAIGVAAGADGISAWPKAHHGRVGPPGQLAEAGIDCLEAIDTLRDCRLDIEVAAPTCPRDLQLLVSLRQRLLDVVVDPPRQTPDIDVPALSQMTCSSDIARQICSPVSVAMVLASLGIQQDPEALARDSFHPQHRMFGIWPANLAAAWRAGASGLLRCFDDSRQAANLLDAGHPIVASIRFEDQALPGAPLPRSSGHLVVLRGLGHGQVTVNDPAGAHAGQVLHHYPREAFLSAWLKDRGVGYVLWPRPPAEAAT